ncbi:MAG: DUF192 domain-containing protein [Bdellovibrionaceae bacterium]|nr:DUF192 domain-containing protein [Pseudobdellovibrionaceae bacterium]
MDLRFVPLVSRWMVAILIFETAVSAFAIEKRHIKVGRAKLYVEVARTQSEHQLGLMNRTDLGDIDGMLFVFTEEAPRTFWMKNTYIDLSIAFFDKRRRLFEMVDLKASSILTLEPDSYSTKKPAQYALEVKKGKFVELGVRVGDQLDLNPELGLSPDSIKTRSQ